ncbi:hypothetical protein MLD52_05835 [Puniceicoccaceae bacterium K14]|nr:hypothetical protein [Puniceicoccaceae bacterium K14]
MASTKLDELNLGGTMFSIGDTDFKIYEVLKYWTRSGRFNSGGDLALLAEKWFDGYIEKCYVVNYLKEVGYDESDLFKYRFEAFSRKMLVRKKEGPYYNKLVERYLSKGKGSDNIFFSNELNVWFNNRSKKVAPGLPPRVYFERREREIVKALGVTYDTETLTKIVEKIGAEDPLTNTAVWPVTEPGFERAVAEWSVNGVDFSLNAGEAFERYFLDPIVISVKEEKDLIRQIEIWALEDLNATDALNMGLDQNVVYSRNKEAYFHHDLFYSYQKFLYYEELKLTDGELRSSYLERLGSFKVPERYRVKYLKHDNMPELLDYHRHLKQSQGGTEVSPSDEELIERMQQKTETRTFENGSGDLLVVEEELLDALNRGERIVLMSTESGGIVAVVEETIGSFQLQFDVVKEWIAEELKLQKVKMLVSKHLTEAKQKWPIEFDFERSEIIVFLTSPGVESYVK